jgi:hypothetical protein
LWREDATATNERWGEHPSRHVYVPDDDNGDEAEPREADA